MLAFKRGLYATARLKFDEIVEKFPDSDYAPKALLNSALCDKNLKDYNSALTKLDRVIKEYPDSSSAPLSLFWKAQTYLAKGDYINAARTARRFVEKYPDHKLVPLALYTSGYAMLLAGRYLSALDDLKKCVESYPKSKIYEKALYRYAQALYLSGKIEKSEKVFRQFISKYQHSKYYPNALYFLGKILYEKRDFFNARKFLAYSVKKKTTYKEEAEFLYSLSLVGSKKFDLARKSLLAFIKKYPRSYFIPDAYLSLATIDRFNGKPDKAIQWAEKVIEHPFTAGEKKRNALKEWLECAIEKGDKNLISKFDKLSEQAQVKNPDKAEMLFDGAKHAFELNRLQIATELLNKALSNNFTPEKEDLFLTAKIFFSSKDYKSAFKWIGKYLSVEDKTSENYPESLYIAFVSSLKTGNLESAKIYYRQLLKNFPDSPYTESAFADITKSVKDKNKLLSLYLEFTKKRKMKSPVYLYNTAELLLAAKKENQAMEIFKQVISRFPDTKYAVKSAIELSIIHAGRGNYGEAMNVLKAVKPQNEKSKLEILMAQAWIMFDRGKYDKAEKLYRKALKIAPDDQKADIWEKIALCKYNTGKYKESRRIIERKVLPLRRSEEEKLKTLLEILRNAIAEENTAKVEEIVEEALSMKKKTPEMEEILFKAGEYLRTEGKTDRAVKIYKTLLDKFPKSDYRETALFWYAKCLEKSGKKELALKTYEKLLDEFPETTHRQKALRFIAKHHAEKGSTEKAREIYSELLKSSDENTKKEALEFLALFEMKNLNYGNAIKYFEKLLNYVSDEEKEKVLEQMSNIYAKLGNRQKLEKTLKDIISSSKDENRITKAMMKLAEIEAKKGNVEKAREWWARIYYEHKKSKLAPQALIKLADSYAKEGNASAEREILEEIVKVYPDTEWAKKATEKLNEIKSELPSTNEQKTNSNANITNN